MLAAFFALPQVASAAAIDDIKIEESQDLCGGKAAADKNYIVYATNLNATQTIDAIFKYDSVPHQQHFILFDANLNPVTDRFPKVYPRRLHPHESEKISCSFTYRAAAAPPGPSRVPLLITKQAAAYVDADSAEPLLEDGRHLTAFILQGGINDCGPGVRPPGMFYLVNLHPYARLSVSLNFREGAEIINLPPLGVERLACSNGPAKLGPVTGALLEADRVLRSTLPTEPTPAHESLQPEDASAQRSEPPALDSPGIGVIASTQNVCAGSVLPPGWIKVNDAWNPTACGNPATITYNIWTIQSIATLPVGSVVQVCKATAPSGWSIVDIRWNPTLCGHPASNQANVMAIKRHE
jgi:hypothetical protein